MKRINFDRKAKKQLRHQRITNKLNKFENDKPRLVVTKSNNNIYAQIIDDAQSKTLVSSSTIQLKLKGINVENAKKVGADIAKKALAKKIEVVVFDRGGSLYHGRIAALADAARENGLKF